MVTIIAFLVQSMLDCCPLPSCQRINALPGDSQGARVASDMAAANPDRTLGCIFFSYPLHTPGNQV